MTTWQTIIELTGFGLVLAALALGWWLSSRPEAWQRIRRSPRVLRDL